MVKKKLRELLLAAAGQPARAEKKEEFRFTKPDWMAEVCRQLRLEMLFRIELCMHRYARGFNIHCSFRRADLCIIVALFRTVGDINCRLHLELLCVVTAHTSYELSRIVVGLANITFSGYRTVL